LPPTGSRAAFKDIRVLYRADDCMRQNLKRSISLRELTLATGAGTLRRIFRSILRMPPKTYLRVLRLNGIHQDLMDASRAEATVESLCRLWSITNLARFTEYYEEPFGETPAETLQRRRTALPALLSH
jgi:AraC family ethanolamine operon transcriptional activator